MKAVLISIAPKWCKLIMDGQKTVEIRKSRPKIDTPFKCYIYCTLSGSRELLKEYGVDTWYKGKLIMLIIVFEIIKYIKK